MNDSSRYDSKSNYQEMLFPAPLNYNYETKLWQSFYTQQQFFDSSENPIPWFRERHSKPVYPILDDTVMIRADTKRNRVTLVGYSSNECSIIRSLNQIEKIRNDTSECRKAHVWCRKG